MLFFTISCKNNLSFKKSTKNSLFQGEWKSVKPEKSTNGTYGTRYFNLNENKWEVRFRLHLDSLLSQPLFEFRGIGTYEVEGKSKIDVKAFNAIFKFEHKYITLLTSDETLISSLGFKNCELIKDIEKDITKEGCSFFQSKYDCSQEFDLLMMKNGQLFFGARPKNGNMCAEEKRPISFNLPLKKKL